MSHDNRVAKILHRVGQSVEELWTMTTAEKLTVLLAAIAVVLALLAYVVASQTFTYMRGRDFDVDTRSGWTEIHKAMVNLRVQRGFVIAQRGAMGGYGPGGPNPFVERKRDYDLATAQLRGQLDRLNDDPLLAEIGKFLEDNKLMEQWETDEYEKTFDGFADKVAVKARPK
jgi:hypothetical protein